MHSDKSQFSWRHPLIIVICGSLVILIGFGTRSTMGIFLVPITEEFEWGRSVFAFAAAIQNLFWGFSQPIFGGIADRYGSGRVILVGGLCYIAGLGLMIFSSTPLGLYFVQWSSHRIWTLWYHVCCSIGRDCTRGSRKTPFNGIGFGVCCRFVGAIPSGANRAVIRDLLRLVFHSDDFSLLDVACHSTRFSLIWQT